MLDQRFVRENIDLVQAALINRGLDLTLEEFIEKYDRCLATKIELEDLQHQRNLLSEQVKQAKMAKEDLPKVVIESSRTVGELIKEKKHEVAGLEDWLHHFMLNLPNIPHASVPIGKSAEDNLLVRQWGQKPIWFQGILLYDGSGAPVTWGSLRNRAYLWYLRILYRYQKRRSP